MLKSRLITLLLIAFSTALPLLSQSLPDLARNAYHIAQNEEAQLKEKTLEVRSRSEYLKVIRLYERVYLITPHTGYADNALINIAALYQEIDDHKDAIKTLRFMIREYPESSLVTSAREQIESLTNPPLVKNTSAEQERVINAGFKQTIPDESVVLVDNIRYWESRRSVRVVIDLIGKPRFTSGKVSNPTRVFVDIEDARLNETVESNDFPVESGILENIRVAQHNPATVRVVLDLAQLTNFTTFTLREPDRLVLDVVWDPAQRKVGQNETPVYEKADGIKTQQKEIRISDPTESPIENPARPAANGDHSLIRSLGLKVGRVVIDPGHGGKDHGTIGPTGLTEKTLVLDIARKLKEKLEREMGSDVIMTRENDTFVPLETRTAIANQSEADLFLSIHANASHMNSIRGFETYFLNLTESREDLHVATRENATSQGYISELQNIVSKIMLRDKMEESREFATHIQQSMATSKQFGKDRGVKQAPFVVLIGANMPAILAEISFISNPVDEQLLKDENRRQQIADALLEGVRSYSNTLSGLRTTGIQE